MRIALFSDIHANLPALEACLTCIDSYRPDATYCLGDLVGYNVWPNEVVREIRRRNIPTIAGNYDLGIGIASDDCGCAYRTEEEKAMGKISIQETNLMVGADERQYLRTLPSHIRFDFKMTHEHLSILLVHGSPRKVNEYLFEDRDEKSLLRILREAEADILCFGHTHLPYHRVLHDTADTPSRFRHAINIGSVGKPKDDDPRGGFVLLTIDEHTSVFEKESLGVEFIRFTYDVEKAAAAIEASPLPDDYARMLRQGK